MQRCNGGPRLKLPPVTEQHFKQMAHRDLKRYKQHIETAKEFEKSPLALTQHLRNLYDKFFGEGNARIGGTVR